MTEPTLLPLALLPAVTYVLLAYQLRPRVVVFAPLRLALIRAAVLLGSCAVVLVEVLGALRALAPPELVVCWSVALLAALGGAIRRYRRDRPRLDPFGRLRGVWTGVGRAERIMAVALLGLILAELLIALVSPPNNFDSQTYHLPKIEHWVVRRDVDFYPTSIQRQLYLAPGAEYLLLHLRLLTGGDAAYNLLQLAAGIGCALLASRIAGQLGGSARAQLLAAFVVATTPIVVLESTSTQTDLVVAAWVASVATLLLDELTRRTPVAAVALLGAATGLTVLTKATGMLAAGPLLAIWLVAQVRRGVPRALLGVLLLGVVTVAVAGPYLNRVDNEYSNPLGPAALRDSISMQRHDPPAVLVNALRIGQTALQTPIGPLSSVTADAIKHVSTAFGIQPSDPNITFWGSTFPSLSWPPDEDRASFPVEGTLILLGAAFVLIRPRRRVPAERVVLARAYAAAFWLALIAYVGTVKWQPWGNRLILFVLVLGAPLAGLWLDSLFRRYPATPAPAAVPSQAAVGATDRARIGIGRRVVAWSAVAAIVVSGGAGWLAAGYGWPRRLVGTGSIFTVSRTQARFIRRPEWQADYEWAAAGVRASGAHRVGLVQLYNTWEYPWWVLLRGDDIVSLQSLTPGIAPARATSTDAIVCVSTAKRCAFYVPKNWTMRMHGTVGYAVPPG